MSDLQISECQQNALVQNLFNVFETAHKAASTNGRSLSDDAELNGEITTFLNNVRQAANEPNATHDQVADFLWTDEFQNKINDYISDVSETLGNGEGWFNNDVIISTWDQIEHVGMHFDTSPAPNDPEFAPHCNF